MRKEIIIDVPDEDECQAMRIANGHTVWSDEHEVWSLAFSYKRKRVFRVCHEYTSHSRTRTSDIRIYWLRRDGYIGSETVPAHVFLEQFRVITDLEHLALVDHD